MAKKSEKKSGGGGAVAGVAILCLLLGGGAGFGYGTGFFGNNNNNSQNSGTEENVPAAEIITENEISDTETEEIPQATEISEFDITVLGNAILKDGNEISVDNVVTEAKGLGESVIVNIKDDSAIADTMDELREKLDSENIMYKIN
ncbi:MAG: hypothetical protein IJM19_07685 [Ruminococcus sp.]|nr:hypothetical protein [Ruminococcus sp.]